MNERGRSEYNTDGYELVRLSFGVILFKTWLKCG